MHNGWFCKGDGNGGKNSYWSPQSMWQHYMQSVGIGWVNTLNAPPGTTGQIPAQLVTNMKAFGAALKTLLKPVSDSASVGPATLKCSNSSAGDSDDGSSVEIDFGTATTFNALMTREDLSKGQ